MWSTGVQNLNCLVAETVYRYHDDVEEDGDRDRQPDGDRVRRDAEVVVEDEVDDPAESVPVVGRRAGVAVEVDGVRDVGGHRQQVGDRERRQQAVGGVQHRAARQNDDVQRVQDDSERADGDAEVAVQRLVGVAEPFEHSSVSRVERQRVRRRLVVAPRRRRPAVHLRRRRHNFVRCRRSGGDDDRRRMRRLIIGDVADVDRRCGGGGDNHADDGAACAI